MFILYLWDFTSLESSCLTGNLCALFIVLFNFTLLSKYFSAIFLASQDIHHQKNKKVNPNNFYNIYCIASGNNNKWLQSGCLIKCSDTHFSSFLPVCSSVASPCFLFPQVALVEQDIRGRPSPSLQKMTNHCCAGTWLIVLFNVRALAYFLNPFKQELHYLHFSVKCFTLLI